MKTPYPHYFAFICIALSGCVSKPYVRPALTIPAHYSSLDLLDANGPKTQTMGFDALDDEKLNRLLVKAQAHNPSIGIAALRVQKAQLLQKKAELDRWPRLTGGLSANQTASNDTIHGANLGIAYMADLWGGVAASHSAAAWEAQATKADQEMVRLILKTSVAELYWQIGFTHQQIATTHVSLVYYEKLLGLVSVQYEAGAVSRLELTEAQNALATHKTLLNDLSQKLIASRAALSLLIGEAGLNLAEEPKTLPYVTWPRLNPGAPIELLSRRPDVAASEMRLRALMANQTIARAALYPALSFGAALSGWEDPVTTISAALSFPFLDYPRHNLAIKGLETDYLIAVIAFKQSLSQAISDTDVALSQRTHLEKQTESLYLSLLLAKRTASLYQLRYEAGAVSLRITLDARERVRLAQLAYDTARLSQGLNWLVILQSIGNESGEVSNAIKSTL